MSLDERLSDLGRRVAAGTDGPSDAAAVDAALAGTLRRRAARRRRRVTALVGAAAVVVAVGAAGLAQVRSTDQDSVGVTSGEGRDGRTGDVPEGAPFDPPPAPATDVPHLVVGEPEVPASGADVPVVLVNPTDAAIDLGLEARLDRWDPARGRWQEGSPFALCGASTSCTARPESATGIAAIGFTVPAGGAWVPQWVRLEGLTTGTYRLVSNLNGRSQGEAEGRFTVAESFAPVPDRPVPGEPPLALTPPIATRPGSEPTVAGVAFDGASFVGGEDAVPAPEAELTARVEAWFDDHWVPMGDAAVEAIGATGPGQPTHRVELRTHRARSYRVLVDGPDETTWEGRYWTELPPVDRSSDEVVDGAAGLPAWTPVSAGLATGPAGELGPRNDLALVDVDGGLVAWGGDLEGVNVGRPELGDPTYADGAVFRPDSGWTAMAPSPLPDSSATVLGVARGPEDPVLGHDGDALIVRGTSAAAYEPSTDAWTELPDLPVAPRHLVWVGGATVALTERGGHRLADDATSDGGWEPIADLPDGATVDLAGVVWTGTELDVFVSGRTEVGGYRWDPATDEWSALPGHPFPDGPAGLVRAVATDDGIVVVAGYQLRAFRYDPEAQTWQDLPGVPMATQEGGTDLLVADGRAVAQRADVVAVLDGDVWTPVPGAQPSPFDPWVAAGDAAYTFGYAYGDGQDRNTLFRLRPDDVLASRTVRLGPVDLALADGWELAGAGSVALANLGETRLEATVRTGGERSCELDLVNGWLGDLASEATVDADGTVRVTPSEPAGDAVEGGPVVLGTVDCDRADDETSLVAALTGWSRAG